MISKKTATGFSPAAASIAPGALSSSREMPGLPQLMQNAETSSTNFVKPGNSVRRLWVDLNQISKGTVDNSDVLAVYRVR